MRSRSLAVPLGGFLGAALLVSGALPACSSQNQQPPTLTTSGTGASGGTGGTSAGGTSSGGGGTGGTSTGGTGGTGTGGTAGAGGTGGTGGDTTGSTSTNCDGPNGCFACAPQANKEFLNACTNAQCSPFDNVARLPLYNGGNLPPVP
jgi:hypothetical protein